MLFYGHIKGETSKLVKAQDAIEGNGQLILKLKRQY